jgi:hypothetical protein
MSQSKADLKTQIEKARIERPSLRRSVWPPALIFIVLTILTIIMALVLKALVTGSIRL